MTPLKTIVVFCVIVVSCARGWSAPTQFTTIDNRSHPPAYYEDKVLQKRLQDEIRPADLDFEGNWGLPANGLQLSLWFPNESFRSDEIIEAILLVRNVSDQTIEFAHGNPERDFTLIATLDKKVVELTPLAEQRANSIIKVGRPQGMMKLPPLHQAKFVIRLGKIYDLSASGKYVVYAKRTIPRLNAAGLSEVRSGNVIINIAGTSSPSDSTATSDIGSNATLSVATSKQSESNNSREPGDHASKKSTVSTGNRDSANASPTPGATNLVSTTVSGSRFSWALVLLLILGAIVVFLHLRMR